MLGDHLGFTAGVAPEMVGPMVAGKFTAGIFALILAWVLTRNLKEPETAEETINVAQEKRI